MEANVAEPEDVVGPRGLEEGAASVLGRQSSALFNQALRSLCCRPNGETPQDKEVEHRLAVVRYQYLIGVFPVDDNRKQLSDHHHQIPDLKGKTNCVQVWALHSFEILGVKLEDVHRVPTCENGQHEEDRNEEAGDDLIEILGVPSTLLFYQNLGLPLFGHLFYLNYYILYYD